MRFSALIESMPYSVRIMVGVFAATPLVSLGFLGNPILWFESGLSPSAVLNLLGYWLLPLALCYALIWRHYLFLPLYLVQCLALFLHSLFHSNQLPLDMAVTRYVLIGFMAYVGFFFGNKDFLAPFLTRDNRLWRRAPRVRVSFEIHLVGQKPEHRIPALMENCSASGMAVAIDAKHTQSFIKKKVAGDSVQAVIRYIGQEHLIPVEIIWDTMNGETRALGLRVKEPGAMEKFVGWVKSEIQYESEILRQSSPLSEQELGETALIVWVVFIALSFGLPAFA